MASRMRHNTSAASSDGDGLVSVEDVVKDCGGEEQLYSSAAAATTCSLQGIQAGDGRCDGDDEVPLTLMPPPVRSKLPSPLTEL